jgi:hypothetical protein
MTAPIPLSGPLDILDEGPAPPLPPDLAETVDALWAAELARRPHAFDGPMFSVTHRDGTRIAGQWTNYRRFMARRRQPALAEALGIRPLAVTGVLRCRDGIVLGRRGDGVTQAAGAFEMAPAGGIAAEAIGPDGRIDPVRQALAELAEEVGLGASAITAAAPLGLAEDPETGVTDIVVGLWTPARFSEIALIHAQAVSAEYATLALVPPDGAEAFLAFPPSAVDRLSAALLRCRWVWDAVPPQ